MSRAIFLVLLIGIAGGYAGTPDMDALVDQVLEMVRPKILVEGKNEIQLKDFTHNLKLPALGIVIGSIRCRNGTGRSLATVYRTGSADGEIFNGSLSFESPLGLRVLEFTYQKCTVEIHGLFSISTTLSGSVENNSIDFKVEVTPEETFCKATIQKIELLQLSGITLSTGPGIADKLRDVIVVQIVKSLNSMIFDKVHTALKAYENTSFHFTNYCEDL